MPIRSRALKGALAIALALALAFLAFVFAVGMTRAPRAHAYGSTALWQVGLSENCDNPAVCGATNLGGFWGWAELDSGGLGDAELTGCSHLQGGPAGGAQHFSANVTSWAVGPDGNFIILSGTQTFDGHGGGSIPIANIDTGVPAMAGHFSAQTIFGMQGPPGTSFNIQVTQLNH